MGILGVFLGFGGGIVNSAPATNPPSKMTPTECKAKKQEVQKKLDAAKNNLKKAQGDLQTAKNNQATAEGGLASAKQRASTAKAGPSGTSSKTSGASSSATGNCLKPEDPPKTLMGPLGEPVTGFCMITSSGTSPTSPSITVSKITTKGATFKIPGAKFKVGKNWVSDLSSVETGGRVEIDLDGDEIEDIEIALKNTEVKGGKKPGTPPKAVPTSMPKQKKEKTEEEILTEK